MLDMTGNKDVNALIKCSEERGVPELWQQKRELPFKWNLTINEEMYLYPQHNEKNASIQHYL